MQAPVYDPEGDTKRKSQDVVGPGHNPGAEHEQNMLENMYNAPSATNNGEKQIGRKNLANMESGNLHGKGVGAFKSEKDGLTKFGAGNTTNSGPSERLGKGYTGKPGKNVAAERKKARKRRTLAGWAIGLILSTGVGSAGLGVLSGPFQFIHASQLMQQLHLEEPENEGDSAMMKFARYVRYRNTPEKLRMGILGNKFADRIEGKFNTNGLESAYTPKFGYLDGYVLDKSQFKGGAFDEVAGKSDSQVKAYFKETYNVDVTTKGGKLYVDANQLKYRQNLRFMDSVLRDAGARRIVRSVQIRVAATRGGISFHPIKNLDKKILTTVEARFAKWNEQLKERITKGAGAAKIATTNDSDQKDKAASQNASELDSETQGIVNEADGATDKTAVSKLQDSLSLKLAGGAAAAVSVICLGHAIAVNFDSVQQSDIIQPLERVGGEMVAVGNQAAFGGGDASDQLAEQLGFYQKRMYNDSDGSSWSDAKSIRSELGQTGGSDINNGAKLSNNPLQVLKNIPGIDSVCKVAGSTAGQAGLFAISLAGGPISAVLSFAAGLAATGPIVSAITDWLVHSSVAKDASGALWGNYMNYGTKLMANDAEASSGGTVVSNSEAIQRKQVTMELDKQEFQSHSLAYRIFNLDDRRSLAGSFLDRQRPNAAANVASLAKGIFNFGSTIASIPQNLFSNKVQAATISYNYGFPTVMHSTAELDNPKLQNYFENACIVVGSQQAGCTKDPTVTYPGILQGGKASDYQDRATKCFGVTLGTDGSVQASTTAPTYQDMKSNNCDDSNEDWQRVKTYIFSDQIMESWGCRYGDTDACANIHFDGAST
jgi:hypothetical protein